MKLGSLKINTKYPKEDNFSEFLNVANCAPEMTSDLIYTEALIHIDIVVEK